MATGFIRIESADDYVFIVAREAACVSGTLKTMLENESFQESETGRIKLDFTANVLSKVVDYMYYHLKYDSESSQFEVPPVMALELLVAADWLAM